MSKEEFSATLKPAEVTQCRQVTVSGRHRLLQRWVTTPCALTLIQNTQPSTADAAALLLTLQPPTVNKTKHASLQLLKIPSFTH